MKGEEKLPQLKSDKMKIGASTLAGIEHSLDTTLEFIENLGLEYAELVHQYPDETISPDITESYSLKYSIHAPFMDVNIASLQSSTRSVSASQIKSSIDLADKINAEAVVVHPGVISFLPNKYFKKEVYGFAQESMIEIGRYGEDMGILTTFENMPAFNSMIYQDINELNDFLTSNGLYMTLDIGHGNHAGYSPDGMIFDSIKHIHIHDNFGDDDAHLPLGEGNIELNHIVHTLEEKNYKGIYIIEVNDYDSIEKSYRYMKDNF